MLRSKVRPTERMSFETRLIRRCLNNLNMVYRLLTPVLFRSMRVIRLTASVPAI